MSDPQTGSEEGRTETAAGDACSEALGRLYDVLDEEGEELELSRLRIHIEECAPCLDELEIERLIKTMVRKACNCEEAPPSVRHSVRMRLQSLDLVPCGDAERAVDKIDFRRRTSA